MKVFKNLLLVLICFFLATNMSYAFFKPKDYKKNFLQDAASAEKRHNDKSAFFIYEKSMFYYKNDKVVMEAYAGFCERRNYLDKAIGLYRKLYDLTKDEYYLYKKYSLELKNTKVSQVELSKIISDNRLSMAHKKEFNNDFIKHFFNKKDYIATKKYCEQIDPKKLTPEAAKACAIATAKLSGDKAASKYYQRYYDLVPKDTENVKILLEFAQQDDNYTMQEKYLKKLSELNPKDNGIKYRLAGFYEKYKQYGKAIKVYEQLIASGDKSKQVLDSYAYAQKAAKGGDKVVAVAKYIPKPLTAQQKKEMQMYEALSAHNFKKTQALLEELLKKYPQNTKYLQLRFDVAMAQNDYKSALGYFEQNHAPPLTKEDTKQLAFLYSKTDNVDKALSLIEEMLQKEPESQDLTGLAREYSMAQKNWDKAIVYTEKLLVNNPTDETFLKSLGDFYSIKKDFAKAASAYERLVASHPEVEYKLTLADLYMANKSFAKAQKIIEPIYQEDSTDPKIIKIYLNILLAQEKLPEAVNFVQKHHLNNTKEGLAIFGDMSIKNKDYNAAKRYYTMAVARDPKDELNKNKLAQTYRMMKNPEQAARIYSSVLAQNPKNKDAKLGLGYVNIDNKQYAQARSVFRDILDKDPTYKPAKVGIVNSYVGNGDDLNAIHSLRPLEPDNEVSLIRGQTYYKMGMLTDAKEALKGVVTKDAQELKRKIAKDEAITITPNYTYFQQVLAQNYKLDYNRVGVTVAQGTKHNLKVFADYSLYDYKSGYMYSTQAGTTRSYSSLANEIRLGVQGRPVEKNEFRADFGAKIFQYDQDAMLVTDSWIKHYFNDKFALKAGFWRNNIEQSYLSAVGTYVNNVFTGRVADNRTYLEYEYRLPRQFYAFGRTSYGIIKGQNIPTNPYMEQMVGIGRLLYNDPDNKLINKVNLDFVSYNSGYRYNLLNIYDNLGNLYGGYFSPRYFSADTLNLKLERKGKKLSYGVKTFGGAQTSIAPNVSTTTWGIAPTVSYDFNDNVSLNLSYNYFKYADMQRNVFLCNLIIRGLK